jgi:hypothetical protein
MEELWHRLHFSTSWSSDTEGSIPTVLCDQLSGVESSNIVGVYDLDLSRVSEQYSLAFTISKPRALFDIRD